MNNLSVEQSVASALPETRTMLHEMRSVEDRTSQALGFGIRGGKKRRRVHKGRAQVDQIGVTIENEIAVSMKSIRAVQKADFAKP